ncbi:hypothetical protein BJV78DRAFT_1285557 [Lactifluus subvellereus]|nr:hypothetical protein BJV78DRAFT_1285557 [Lactifluus subvellereus]
MINTQKSARHPLVKVLAWTETEELTKNYDLLRFISTLEFLIMLALSIRRLLEAHWNRQKVPFFSKLLRSTLHAPSPLPGDGVLEDPFGEADTGINREDLATSTTADGGGMAVDDDPYVLAPLDM